MKAVALILALAVITGCNARAVRQAQTVVPSLEDTKDFFWQHISELNKKADGVLDNLKASQLGRELDTLITDTMAEVETFKEDLQTKIGGISATKGVEDLQLLADRLQQDMLDAKERSMQYLGELQSMVGQNTEEVRSRLGTYTHKLKKRLDKDTEEIRNTMTTYMGEVQSRASQGLDATWGNVEPLVQRASETGKKVSEIPSIVSSHVEQLGSQAAVLKTQLGNTAEELRTTLEGKIDTLTEMLTPLATKIREQLENIMDKVKETAPSA